MSNLVVVPDVHLDPGTPFDPSYLAVKRFIGDMRPTAIVVLGDFGNFQCFNHHDKRKRLLLEGHRYRASCDQVKQELDDLQRCTEKLYYCLGNHEEWVHRYIEEHPELAGAISLPRDLELNDRCTDWCEVGDVLQYGKINFTHGDKINKHHAKTMAEEIGDHIFYGHTHDHQEYTPHFRKDRSPYAAVSCGCLCSKNPSYMKPRVGNRWINGFVYIEFRPDWNFNHHWLAIVDGVFAFGGRIWQG
jgi:UDP-2,3-diacylglucosamine pyrophosphatase LpxH